MAVHELSREVVQNHLWYLDEHPAHSSDLATHRLASAVLLSAKIRPFPVVARQVLSLLGDEDYRTADLEGVIMKDPALSATFLRIANSALYRQLVPCESVLMACARLGRNAVREIVVGVATMDMFRDVRSRGATIRNHCAGTAAIARTLADEWHLRSGDQLFLTGLLHDFGKLLCMQAGIESYDGLPPDALDTPDRLHLIERDRLGYDHAVLGAHVLHAWKIPDAITQVVAWHHQPARAYAGGGTVGMQVALLRLADRLEYRLRHDSAPNEAAIEDLSTSDEARHMGFSAADLRSTWQQMIDSRDEVLALFR
ncbi:MAG TPA: HDOD domain-containing protein [Polyangiaceae bacterium]